MCGHLLECLSQLLRDLTGFFEARPGFLRGVFGEHGLDSRVLESLQPGAYVLRTLHSEVHGPGPRIQLHVEVESVRTGALRRVSTQIHRVQESPPRLGERRDETVILLLFCISSLLPLSPAVLRPIFPIPVLGTWSGCGSVGRMHSVLCLRISRTCGNRAPGGVFCRSFRLFPEVEGMHRDTGVHERDHIERTRTRNRSVRMECMGKDGKESVF